MSVPVSGRQLVNNFPFFPPRADTFQGGEARGALSWAFIKSLNQRPNQSYLQLLNSIRAELEGKYSQKPQLSCSHPLGKSVLFVLEAHGS